jgi:hypothetical protein
MGDVAALEHVGHTLGAPGVAGLDYCSERFQLVAEMLSSNPREEIDLKLRRYREAPDNLYLVVIQPREFTVGARGGHAS